MHENCLLTVIVSPSIEEAMTDWFLSREDVTGFSSHLIFGHGVSEHSMTLSEQVVGKQKEVAFHLHLPHDRAHRLITALRKEFAQSGVHYWLVPVLDAGHLN